MRCSSGILFNHESPLRGREIVTRKISYQMAEMKRGRDTPIQLGNLSSVRDWGYAPDFILAMEMIINAKKIDDWRHDQAIKRTQDLRPDLLGLED